MPMIHNREVNPPGPLVVVCPQCEMHSSVEYMGTRQIAGTNETIVEYRCTLSMNMCDLGTFFVLAKETTS